MSDVGVNLRDGSFKTDIVIANLHPIHDTHWVLYLHEWYFHSYGITPPKKHSRVINKRNGHCLCSDYKIEGVTSKRDSYCAASCLNIIHLTKVLGIDFNSAVLKLYYHRFPWKQMTLRKIPVDKIINNVAQIEQTQSISRDHKPNTMNNN